MAPENLQKTVINNLFEILRYYGLGNDREKMADYLHVKYPTFRAWISYNRSPSLETLDELSDTLSIPTHILLIPDLQLNDVGKFIEKGITNNSPLNLDRNLMTIYTEKELNSWQLRESAYGSLLSQDTLKSYHRKKDKRTPPINTLEKMSTYLGIPAYKLIIGGKDYEYKSYRE